jgi:hypothetical protein
MIDRMVTAKKPWTERTLVIKYRSPSGTWGTATTRVDKKI